MGDYAVAFAHNAELHDPTLGSSIEHIIEEPVVTHPEPSSSSRTTEFILGIRDQAPILLGVAPFGIIFGALAIASGIPPLEAQAFSLFIFAGSAQFIAVGLIAEGTGALIVVLTIFIVNLRHMLYSASMARYFKPLNLKWKFSLSWLLTDEAFAVASTRYRRGPMKNAHWYTLGTGLALWGTWQVSTAIGILLGAGIPKSWNLAFALPLTFL
ncbi:MAG: AzlC family ABC transporter permease, partial [Anaerolineales bacterium]